jgi:hypothetical protein
MFCVFACRKDHDDRDPKNGPTVVGGPDQPVPGVVSVPHDGPARMEPCGVIQSKMDEVIFTAFLYRIKYSTVLKK